jgi:hypothetical protein
MNELKLKPCPFCGAPAEFEYTDYNHETGKGGDGMGHAQCTNRMCGIGFFDDRDAAVEKWNSRVKPNARLIAAAPDLLEALRDAYCHIALLATGQTPPCSNAEAAEAAGAAIAKAKVDING